MAKGVKELKQRIRGVKNIAQITSAMEMVATTKLKRLQERASASRPYADKIQGMVGMLAGTPGVTEASPLMEAREVKKTGLVLISGDRGLCGSYNSNIFKCLLSHAAELGEVDKQLFIFGKKGAIFFKKREIPIAYTFDGVLEKITYSGAKEVARQLRTLFLGGEVDEVYLYYTRFLSTVVQRPYVQKLLPLSREDLLMDATGEDQQARPAETQESGVERRIDFILEPSPEAIFEHLLPKFVEVKIYSALMESLASEYAARRVAMKSATDASRDIIKSLTKQYNRARQETITKELLEVVGGAEALRG